MKVFISLSADLLKNASGKSQEFPTVTKDGAKTTDTFKVGRGKILKYTATDTVVKVWLEGTRAYSYMSKRQFAAMKKMLVAAAKEQGFQPSVLPESVRPVSTGKVTPAQDRKLETAKELFKQLKLPEGTVKEDGSLFMYSYVANTTTGKRTADAIIARAVKFGFKKSPTGGFVHSCGAKLHVAFDKRTILGRNGSTVRSTLSIGFKIGGEKVPVKVVASPSARIAFEGKYDPKVMKGREYFEKINGKSKALPFVEGFWRDTYASKVNGLPFPVPMSVKGYSWAKFKPMLEDFQDHSQTQPGRGTSPHRWTGKPNGGNTYMRGKWKWPSGLTSYFSKGVPPSRAFYLFVTGEDNTYLPTYGRP